MKEEIKIMKKYYEVLKTVELLKGIEADQFEQMFSCLGASLKRAEKGESLLRAGERPVFLGIVLSGELHIVKEGLDGERTIVAPLGKGDIFAEALCCAGIEESPVSVFAAEEAVVLLLRFDRILHTCSNACVFHQKLIENMLLLIARKNIMLQSRMDIMRLKTIRAKVLSYLDSFPHEAGGEVAIPFSREEMADFLCVERSALSHELSKMKREGLLDYRKNRFTLKTGGK